MIKSITTYYDDFLAELDKGQKVGRYSPLSRAEALILQIFVDFVNEKSGKTRVVSYEYNDFDVAKLAEALIDFGVYVQEIDTESSYYFLVFSDRPLSKQEAEERHKRWVNG